LAGKNRILRNIYGGRDEVKEISLQRKRRVGGRPAVKNHVGEDSRTTIREVSKTSGGVKRYWTKPNGGRRR